MTAIGRVLARFRWWSTTPEPDPLKLTQKIIFVLPTRAGWAFAGALAVMLLASINYRLSLGYAFVFLLAGAGAVSIIHAFANLLHLSIHYGKVESAFCGGNVTFHLLIANPSRRRRPALTLTAKVDADIIVSTEFELPANDKMDVPLVLPALHRGVLPMGRTTLETRWPLGLIRTVCVFVPTLEAHIWPAPEQKPPPLSRSDGTNAANLGPDHPGIDDFSGLRPWQETDSPRHLAWKVFARDGEMLTKQFSTPEAGEICLDWHTLPGNLPDEARLSRLAAWLLKADHSGQRYAMRLPGATFPLGHGEQHLTHCLDALAEYP